MKTIEVKQVLKSMRADKSRPKTKWSTKDKETLLYNDVAVTEFLYVNFYGVYKAFRALQQTKVKTVDIEVNYGDDGSRARIVIHTDALEYHFWAVEPTNELEA